MEKNIWNIFSQLTMNKNSLLLTIAQKGYNIGFGAKKHFISYNNYSKTPKLLSLLVIFIGIFQLLTPYKTSLPANCQEYISAILINIGIVALIIDSGSKNKEDYNRIGKILTGFFNELQSMYNEVKVIDESASLQKYIERIQEIENEFQRISISDQFPFTHIYTNLTFFFGGTQINWINEQLHFTYKDKFPFYHSETFIIYFIIILISYFLITG